MEHRAVGNSAFRATGLEVANRHTVISAAQGFEDCVDGSAVVVSLNVLGNEADGAVAHQEVSTTDMVAGIPTTTQSATTIVTGVVNAELCGTVSDVNPPLKRIVCIIVPVSPRIACLAGQQADASLNGPAAFTENDRVAQPVGDEVKANPSFFEEETVVGTT